MRSARVDRHGSGTLTNALSPPTQFGTATQHSETYRLAVGWNPIDTFPLWLVSRSPALTHPWAFSAAILPRAARAMLRPLIDGTAYFSHSHHVWVLV